MSGEINTNWYLLKSSEKAFFIIFIIMAVFSLVTSIAIFEFYIFFSNVSKYFLKFLIMISFISTLCSICVIINIPVEEKIGHRTTFKPLLEDKGIQYLQANIFTFTEISLPLWVFLLVFIYYFKLKGATNRLISRGFNEERFWARAIIYLIIPILICVLISVSKNSKITEHGKIYGFGCNKKKSFCFALNAISQIISSVLSVAIFVFFILIFRIIKNIGGNKTREDISDISEVIKEFGYQFLIYPGVAVICFIINILFSNISKINGGIYAYISSFLWSAQGVIFPLTVGISTGSFKALLWPTPEIKLTNQENEIALNDNDNDSEGSGI